MLRLFACFASCVVNAANVPIMPQEYTAVISMKMPYIPLEMPLRVLTSATSQKIEYFDGLQVDVSNAKGTYKYVFNNSERVCMFSPASAGPTQRHGKAFLGDAWKANVFFPDLSTYNYTGDELVGGIL